MSLTLQQIYERYNIINFARVIEIKRRNTDNSYESTWQNIETLSGLELFSDAVKSINYKLTNNSYNFGIVNINDAILKLNSKFGQFADENNANSIFNGFIRHKSLLRIRDGYVDKYTDPNNPTDILHTVFEGFIDDVSNSTKVSLNNFEQELLIVDKLSFLLKEYTINDFRAYTSTLLSDLIYEILNRSEFTDYFTVLTGNIIPGYDISSFDESKYEGQTQLFTVFEDFSLGHSFFYVKDNVFYYKSIDTGVDNNLTVDESKIIKFSNFENGIHNVIERWNWEDSTESYVATQNIYNRGKTMNIDGCTNTTQRQNLLNFVGERTKIKKQLFQLTIPYYPNIFILDKIVVSESEIIPDNAFVWDVSKWDESYWAESYSGSNIGSNNKFLVREVKHNKFVTILILQEDI